MMLVLLQFFQYAHLAADLAAVAQPFAELANKVADLFGHENPQALTAVQKLLEAKDCAVRAHILKRAEPPAGPGSGFIPSGTMVPENTTRTEAGAIVVLSKSSRCRDCFKNENISPISGLCPDCEARLRAKGARL